jgi:L-asparaginase II
MSMVTELWDPLFSIERSGRAEVTVHGIVSVQHGAQQSLLAVGNMENHMWSRSLLKPWQLLAILPTLKQTYPQLTPCQLAIMMSSHNGEPEHLEVIQSLILLGNLEEGMLQCPACYPMSSRQQFRLKEEGKTPRSLYNACSGKHFGQLLALRAMGENLSHYIQPDMPHYQTLRQLLAQRLGRPIDTLPHTVDGCHMPNYAMSANELARMFCELAGNNTDPALAEVRGLMQAHPFLIGGTCRLDTRIISGELTPKSDLSLVAKEGADGLLGVGIAPCNLYPKGLGILIKLASGYEPRYMEIVISALLEQLGLRQPSAPEASDNPAVTTRFHFTAASLQEV